MSLRESVPVRVCQKCVARGVSTLCENTGRYVLAGEVKKDLTDVSNFIGPNSSYC